MIGDMDWAIAGLGELKAQDGLLLDFDSIDTILHNYSYDSCHYRSG
jgi:hypothetical protein